MSDLPGWANKVKIKHHINYTCGIPNFTVQSDETDAPLLAYLKDLKALSLESRTAYLYAQSNAYLQKRISEKVSGLSYADFGARHILKNRLL